MRDLTIHELESELAEQLPARELMGCCWHPAGNTNIYNVTGSGDGNGNSGFSVGDGTLDGNTVNVYL